ncbi:Panacea domain-containing protein [Saccharomonospora piscinae]|uniref:Panacea domain-containing protein n=1 Tax=Saccharomonospora piscinae TaxID=687388 RepID=UPI0004646F3D|nr:type II toxin-antitoxin system antitoxin SocA domain-containing protein [Saccharomonospora piscinae]
MADVLDTASYILSRQGSMTAMKLQKLCYYAYAYHLAWEERQLFPERFEAWANGPVCPQLYQRHRGQFQLAPQSIGGAPERLDDGERESIDLVLDGIGHMSAHQLSEMTHREPPWQRARERAKASDLERSNEPLLDADIGEFFEALTAVDGQ